MPSRENAMKEEQGRKFDGPDGEAVEYLRDRDPL